MPSGGKTVSVRRPESRQYVAKAQQFLEQAQSAAASQRHDATMLNAIHAAITSADAVTTALAGRRSTDPDHARAADLLEEVGRSSPPVRQKAKQLRTLLAKKNAVEYESRRATAKEARDALRRAERLVAWAAETVTAARF